MLAHGGRDELARARAAESLALGERLGDPVSRGQGHAFAALVELAVTPDVGPEVAGELAVAVRSGR
ncbi:MAG: hypothetical protein U5R31_11645 [Acidimicrobiia bacterium]|nr:hypothetical protein [Acidimicrobiia bacterium]